MIEWKENLILFYICQLCTNAASSKYDLVKVICIGELWRNLITHKSIIHLVEQIWIVLEYCMSIVCKHFIKSEKVCVFVCVSLFWKVTLGIGKKMHCKLSYSYSFISNLIIEIGLSIKMNESNCKLWPLSKCNISAVIFHKKWENEILAFINVINFLFLLHVYYTQDSRVIKL